MFARRGSFALAWILCGASLAGCVGVAVEGGNNGATGSTGGSMSPGGTGNTSGSGGSNGNTGTGNGSGQTGTGGMMIAPPPPTGGTIGAGGEPGTGVMVSELLPARVRRLTNAEYEATVRGLLSLDANMPLTTNFPPDARQKLGYTLNDAQIVSSVLATQLDATAQTLVAASRSAGRTMNLAPCSNASTQGETCAKSFIEKFGEKAYRRPLTADDVNPLLALYRAGAGNGGTYDQGIDLVMRAILQSPNFLYVSEIGQGTGNVATLTGHELANTLSYFVTASPPDDALLAAAKSGELATPAGREQHLRRLIQTAPSRDRLVRMVREWLGIDGIAAIAKDTTVYPNFPNFRNAMAAESASFVNEVLQKGTGTVAELFGADWTFIDSARGATSQEASAYLTGFYGLGSGTAGTRAMLTSASGGSGRVGILNQGAFLSVFAHASTSAPVLRGVAIMRRIACMNVVDPVELNINVVPPVPDPAKPQTTRQLFAVHATDAACSSCHKIIDGFGFSFEQFDGMGAYRTGGKEVVKTTNGNVSLDVDSKTTIMTGTDLDGTYADSNALAAAIARSATVRACMARQMFRASAGRSDASVKMSEDAFVRLWSALPAEQQGKVIETLVAFVKSPLFSERRNLP